MTDFSIADNTDEERLKQEEYMITFLGNEFHVFNPNENEINILDIAHSLSLQCRFNGHSSAFYSVAQHLLIGSELIIEQFKKEYFGHDFTETYTGDLISPIKRRSPEFYKMEGKIEKIISKKYELTYPMSKEVKEMDSLMLRMELSYLTKHKNKTNEIFPISKEQFLKLIDKTPAEVEKLFLARFKEVTKGKDFSNPIKNPIFVETY